MVRFLGETVDGSKVLGIVLLPGDVLDLVDREKTIDIDIEAMTDGDVDTVRRVVLFYAENEDDVRYAVTPFIDANTVVRGPR